VARFELHGALPCVTQTLRVAEQTRRALLSQARRLAQRRNPALADAQIGPLAPAFWGKDVLGRPLRGHPHAFFLPSDDNGDGRLDHLTLVAAQGFNDLERQALAALRYVALNRDDRLEVQLESQRPATAGPLEYPPAAARNRLTPGLQQLTGQLLKTERPPAPASGLLGISRVWVSATPFVATRYPKLRGRKRDRPADYATPGAFARQVLLEELARFGERGQALPALLHIETLASLGSGGIPPGQFACGRRKGADDGMRRARGAFRMEFAASVRGPLCLGHGCHFGLGLFVPERGVQVEQVT
jgi:CRISPR-associated protein Csb2